MLFLYFLSGCKENPVIPKNNKNTNDTSQFDTARYKWTADTLRYFGSNYEFILDTNHWYLVSDYNFIYYNGTNYIIYNLPNNFWARHISGYDLNNIFIDGNINSMTNERPAYLIFNGSSFNEIIIPDSLTPLGSYINYVYTNNLNDFWLLLNNGKIIKYNGINYNIYITRV